MNAISRSISKYYSSAYKTVTEDMPLPDEAKQAIASFENKHRLNSAKSLLATTKHGNSKTTKPPAKRHIKQMGLSKYCLLKQKDRHKIMGVFFYLLSTLREI